MTRTVNVLEAKTQLSKLIDAALRGEEVIIARAGTPVVTLKPVVRPRRIIGLARGRGEVRDEFFAPLPDDVLRDFEGNS